MFEPLPDALPIAAGVRKGRVPKEGYQRGWGLQFGGLHQKIETEQLFKEATMAAAPLAPVTSHHKRANIYLILTRFLPHLQHQNVIEFGAFKGGTSIFMASILRAIAPAAKLYALDTFEGMPETDRAIDAHGAGDFVDASIHALIDTAKTLGLDNLVPVKGLFQDTFPTLDSNISFGLAHIDADIYSAIKFAQDAVWPQMTKGGYVIYDDADISSCLGATEAVEELIQERKIHSEQIWPHFVFRVGLKDR
jgi:predicted O-methyltransferase YrrM